MSERVVGCDVSPDKVIEAIAEKRAWLAADSLREEVEMIRLAMEAENRHRRHWLYRASRLWVFAKPPVPREDWPTTTEELSRIGWQNSEYDAALRSLRQEYFERRESLQKGRYDYLDRLEGLAKRAKSEGLPLWVSLDMSAFLFLHRSASPLTGGVTQEDEGSDR